MMSDKSAARARRILKMIAQQNCHLEPTNNADFLVLNFVGLRTIKCHRKWLADWLNRGQIAVRTRNKVSVATITEEGLRHLDRGESGDFADQHRMLVEDCIETGGQRETVIRNVNESPLAKLYHPMKGNSTAWLDSQEFSAGERLRSDFEFAHLGPKITASWDPTANLSGGKGARSPQDTLSERAMAARARLTTAIDAVGPELSGILLDVCCYLKGLEQIESERQWPRRSAKLILKTALSVLARHYAPSQNHKAGKLRHWGGEGYRPNI